MLSDDKGAPVLSARARGAVDSAEIATAQDQRGRRPGGLRSHRQGQRQDRGAESRSGAVCVEVPHCGLTIKNKARLWQTLDAPKAVDLGVQSHDHSRKAVVRWRKITTRRSIKRSLRVNIKV